MYIFLLDQSGSMSEPFQGSSEPSLRDKLVDVEIKFDAAREVLKEDIRELIKIDPKMSLAIYAFNSEAKLVYHGKVEDTKSIDLSVDTLEPFDGTNIAAALKAAAKLKETITDKFPSQVVLISDGKSERVEAMAAARQCVEQQLTLSMLLIDPTDEGKKFALDVVRSAGGTYQSVKSRAELRKATKKVAESYSAMQSRAQQYLESSNVEAAEVEKQSANREKVKFTSGYPTRIEQAYNYYIRVYAHLEMQEKEVKKKLDETTKQFGAYDRMTDTHANQKIPIGTNLEITPRINYIEVNPTQHKVTWTGAIEEAIFRISYAGPKQSPYPPCSGFIDISTSGLIIAQIPISIQVETGDATFEKRVVEMISRIFASYSHKDEKIVRACKEAYKALGIQLFVDKDNIICGKKWRDVIGESIANHDLFQLYWSQAAADSDRVTDEWEIANAVASRKAINFIRPLYWTEPMPTPPQELGHLHFARLNLDSLKLSDSQSNQQEKQQDFLSNNRASKEVQFPIIEGIDIKPIWKEWLQKNMGEVVFYLENLIGARYFPPVTFLVDEHIVQATREELTVDTASESNGEIANKDKKEIEYILEILQALALSFHVGQLSGQGDKTWSERASFYEATDEKLMEDYNHVAYVMEYIFAGLVKNYFLTGKDEWSTKLRMLRNLLEDFVNNKSEYLTYTTGDLLKQVEEKATPDELLLSGISIDKAIRDLKSFNSYANRIAAEQVLNSNIPQLADKYNVFEFFGSAEPNSFRHYRTFLEYLQAIIQQWLSYIRIAVKKRSGTIIDIGRPINEATLMWLQKKYNIFEINKRESSLLSNDNAPVDTFKISIEEYESCVTHLSQLLFNFQPKSPKNLITTFINTAVSTYGIYIPAYASGAQKKLESFMNKKNWPLKATLPGQHKVLLCMNTIEQFKEKLIGIGWKGDEAQNMAERFGLSILIHEHFHAAVATGLDIDGRAALGAQYPERWDKATALNESLAVWCERQYFRDDAKMLEQIDAYITEGEYPVWPYRGGEVVESIYTSKGVSAIRNWMRYLRDDPENSQREFDKHVSAFTLTRKK